jgi:hypothetical protein
MLGAALAAWLSQGTRAFTSPGGERVALLPLSAGALVLVLAAAVLAVAAARRRASLAPFALLLLPVLPWLPTWLPSAFQVWSGPIVLLVWLALLLALAGHVTSPFWPRTGGWAGRRPRLVAGILASALYAVAAWQVSPMVPGGDEPHYLIITQSLLEDGDIKIENNHQQGDYLAYFAGSLRPDFRVRGRDGEIYSIHAPGVSALVAPAFALGGYRGVVVFLVLLAAAGSALVWHLAWKVTGLDAAAWFTWTAVTCSTTAVFHSFTVYPDGPGGVIALTGVWALTRLRDEAESGSERVMPWFLHGTALAMLPWLHSRFAVLAGGLGALVLLRLATTRNPAGKAAAFLLIPALSAFAWLAFFIAIYGTPDPSAPYGNEPGSFTFIPGGLTGLFFDQRFGLLVYAPVLAFGLGGLALMLARRTRRALNRKSVV